MVKIYQWRNKISALTTRQQGLYYEDLAKRHLQAKGLAFIAANVVCCRGEIDLIMQDQDGTFVFVEVRYRKNALFGHAVETIDRVKQQKIYQSAREWIQKKGWNEADIACRFDVFVITQNKKEWIQHAFSCDENG